MDWGLFANTLFANTLLGVLLAGYFLLCIYVEDEYDIPLATYTMLALVALSLTLTALRQGEKDRAKKAKLGASQPVEESCSNR